jgi:endonuclease G
MITLTTALRARVQLALREAARRHLFDPNVGLVDFGFAAQGGHLRDDALALRVHVHRKLAPAALEVAAARGLTAPIAAEIGGFPTDVVQASYATHPVAAPPASGTTHPRVAGSASKARRGDGPRPQWALGDPGGGRGSGRALRVDPLQGGTSISNALQRVSGTLGAVVLDRASRAPMLLSNWHVLVGGWQVPAGVPIVQPGRLDGGGSGFGTVGDRDVVGRLARDAFADRIDAAVALLGAARPATNLQWRIGAVTGRGAPALGAVVVKSGRTSGVTAGRVVGVEGLSRIRYFGLDRIVRDVVSIDPLTDGAQVSAAGDSGSLWLDAGTHAAVALHFAGSNLPERALAMDIGAVLDALRIDLL